MVFPVHLKKIASVVGTPWQYYQIVHCISTPEQFSDLRLAVFEELGHTTDCYELLLQLTKDILRFHIEQFRIKPTEGVIAQFNATKFDHFLKEVICMSPFGYHSHLQEFCEQMKISGDSELIKFV